MVYMYFDEGSAGIVIFRGLGGSSKKILGSQSLVMTPAVQLIFTLNSRPSHEPNLVTILSLI